MTNQGGRRLRVNGWLLDMEDGERDLRHRVRETDCEGVTCLDPNRCVVSKTVERGERAQGRPCKVTVWNTIVLVVPLKTVDGVEVPVGKVVRYRLSQDTLALRRHFDNEGSYPPGVVVELLPPAPYQRLGQRKPSRGIKDSGAPHQRRNPERTLPTRGHVQPELPPAPAQDDPHRAA